MSSERVTSKATLFPPLVRPEPASKHAARKRFSQNPIIDALCLFTVRHVKPPIVNPYVTAAIGIAIITAAMGVFL
ncbi:hypothetical protein BOA8489_03928 [Boseongicola aestuarii]|uniref:Uncharacterized protein n=1 Tax=Boseongicola aestuarii TaxID=1470561 RepID=A0A238J7D4_9RHOB|nr:hypothetical protein BOA8489_03928 [Boseongicola aestuarii]